MSDDSEAVAAAALSIGEALPLRLVDRRIPTAADVVGVLEDAAARHLAPAPKPTDAARGAAAAALIRAIAEGRNTVRRRQLALEDGRDTRGLSEIAVGSSTEEI